MLVLRAAVLGMVVAIGGVAAAKPSPRSPVIDAVANCKSEAQDAARLRCYDAAVAALLQATSAGAIIVVNREDVRKTRRSLFGFQVPKLPFFGGDDSQEDKAPDELQSTVRSARSLGNGKWLIEIEGGALWQTTEASSGFSAPKSGQPIRIKRGAIGNYFLSVAKDRAVRAMRVR